MNPVTFSEICRERLARATIPFIGALSKEGKELSVKDTGISESLKKFQSISLFSRCVYERWR